MVYFDDDIVFPKSFHQHLQDVESVLRTLQKARVTLELKKCDFFTKTVKYLFHTIRPGQLSIDEVRIKSLKGMQHPRTLSELRSFMCLGNLYRRFIPGYTNVATPHNTLLWKEMPANLSSFEDEEKKEFRHLIHSITSSPVLALPRTGFPFSVNTESSNYQSGAALFQTQLDGERKLVGFWSRSIAEPGP